MTLAAVANDHQDSRFYVQRTGTVVCFLGVLSDVTTFEALDDVLTDGCTVDMANLKFASWMGLTGLRGFLAAKKCRVTMRGVPEVIFATTKLIGGLSDWVAFESFEIRGYDLAKAGHVSVPTTVAQLRQQLDKDGELTAIDSYQVLSPLRYVLPDLFGTEVPLMPPSAASPEDYEGLTFWAGYQSFVQATLEICGVLLAAGAGNIGQLLGEIRSKVESCEKAMALLDPQVHFTLVRRVDQTIAVAEDAFNACSQAMEQACIASLQPLCVARSALASSPVTVAIFLSALEPFFTAVQNFHPVASRLEEEGTRLGGKIVELRAIHVIKNALAGVSEPSPEILAKLREAFAIMDVLSDGDWGESRKLILAEVVSLDGSLGNLIVTMQSFDLVRQLIEHRMQEAAMFLADYPAICTGGISQVEVAAALVNTVAATLVTDQEKHAFSFFLPVQARSSSGAERSEPGDVLLF